MAGVEDKVKENTPSDRKHKRKKKDFKDQSGRPNFYD